MAEEYRSAKIDVEQGKRLYKALTATSDELFQVLLDPEMLVLRSALKNQFLNEDHLLALLKRRDLSEDLLKSIYQLEIAKGSHRLQVALVKNPGTPGPVALALLPHLHLFELVDLCLIPGVTPDQKFGAERAILQRLPTTELGNKMTLARRATTTVVGEILKGGEPGLVEICLGSPRLREVAILQFINGATSSAETISIIGRHAKWKTRPNLRLAILKNRRTPAIWFTLFLPQLRTPDVKNLLASRRLSPSQKKLVQDELKKRGLG
ncbi:MAG: hypothetical protein KAU27_14050 [Desulfuromonadales bacterium]|nr:hypothetical protein [Desulfuromonadales bacterium]